MTFEISSPLQKAPRQRTSVADRLDSTPGALLVGIVLLLALTLGKVVAVWQTGIFFGPDDAMRASEVRDLLAGQGWFDLVPKRMAPDHPFPMHWSRLADLPLALAIGSLRWITDPETAERLTRLIEPVAFYGLLLATLAALMRELCGRGAALAVVLLLGGSLEIVADFMPGRIHHHALQLLLLAVLTKWICDGLDPRRSHRMAWAGSAAALSLAINLQNMPFVAVAAALIGLMWVVQGPSIRTALERFGLGLAASAVVVFLVQVPPGRYLAAGCDAFGAPHLLATSLGGLTFWLLGRASGVLSRPGARLAGLTAAGLVVIGALALTYPACLGDPYGGVDALVRDGWMADVGEAMPLPRLLGRDPFGTAPIVMALIIGAVGIIAAGLTERGLARQRWILIAGLAATALAGTFWQIRVAASAGVFTACGSTWLLCRLFAGDRRSRPYAALLACMTGLVMTSAGWTAGAAALQPDVPQPTAGSAPLEPIDIERCFAPSSFEALRKVPPGLVLSTIDPGAHILVHTAHSVVAGPYHRNTWGIRLALQALQAKPPVAMPMIIDAKVDTIALCTASVEVHDIVRTNPDSLTAEILSGHLPAWLSRIDSPGPYRLYAVRRQ